MQGVVATPLDAKQVAGSLIPLTTTSVDVLGLRSAIPDGAGKVVMSMTRNLKRVTAAPVVFTTRRRISKVPNVELFAGSEVKSLTRLGGDVAPMVESSNSVPNDDVRSIGDARFSGPGASQTLTRPGTRAVCVYEIEVRRRCCSYQPRLRRTGKRPSDRNRALFAAVVSTERIVDRERRQSRIASAFFVECVGFTG